MVSDAGFDPDMLRETFQSALRFAAASDNSSLLWLYGPLAFQSALRFAVASDSGVFARRDGGREQFQSALRFAVVSDVLRAKVARPHSCFNPL